MKNNQLMSCRYLAVILLITLLFFSNACINSDREVSKPTFNVPNTVIIESVELEVRDADGIDLGDFTGNGKIDILTSNGDYGTTMWFEQGDTWKDWTRHHIYTIADAPREIEGNALGDFNGDGHLEAISLDQPNGNIYLHKRGDDVRGDWETAIILSDRQLVQEALVTDIDGDGRPDLVYTWEGREIGNGGVYWLKLTGDNPLNPDHWQDHIMTTHESAWWLAPHRADISGNGKAIDFVFTARHHRGRNPGSRPGLFWMEPNGDVTAPWTVRTIDETLEHPLHVDMGDLSGEGHGLDLVVGGFNTSIIYWYEYSKNWKRHELPVPVIKGVQPDRVWNVKTLRLGGEREGIFAPVNLEVRGQDEDDDIREAGAWLFYEYLNGQFQPAILREIDYRHPTDDRIMLFDVTGDGQAELFIPDSGPDINLLHILRLGRDWPE